MLKRDSQIQSDEEYTSDEKRLDEFCSLHPMLDLSCVGSPFMQLASSLLAKVPVDNFEPVEACSKEHDDQFLRRPKLEIGERECACGQKCLAVFVARLRFGDGSPRGFVCREHLTPSQLTTFDRGEGLPSTRQKCLLCARYFTMYAYTLALHEPSFKPPASLSLSPFQNALGDMVGASMNCTNGYARHAMLHVGEAFSDLKIARETALGQLFTTPTVRFSSRDYQYVEEDGEWRIVQVGIGADDPHDGLAFKETQQDFRSSLRVVDAGKPQTEKVRASR